MELPTEKPYYKSVYFDLPFLVSVRDGFGDKTLQEWSDALTNEEELPHCIYAPRTEKLKNPQLTLGGADFYLPQDDFTSAYIVDVDGIKVGVQFLKRINTNNNFTIAGEVQGDRAGRAAFSSVRVNFPLEQFTVQNTPEQLVGDQNFFWNSQFFVVIAIEAVNKFLSHYRIIAKKSHIKPISSTTIQQFRIYTSFKNDSDYSQFYITNKNPIPIPERIRDYLKYNSFHFDGEMRGLGYVIDDNQDKEIRESLTNNKKPSLLATIDMEIQDRLSMGEYRLAAIESGVFFEAFLYDFLRMVYKEQGLNEQEIEKKFLQKDGKRPMSITDIAKKRIIDSIGFDFFHTKEFVNWQKKTVDLRNDIVHGKILDVSMTQALESVDASLKANHLLRDKYLKYKNKVDSK